ncbi:NmrA-like family protein/NmrA family protein [Blumeria hordei DH14]|uniref:NmrA-like family protein/NmrA family protein n=1 Tax=Blumeria graminis f. sp. hordei (strain DH14) TaxID=546991 RepID=N1J5X7_BLUG1|nr:NmrA-like family protein/NmrA family protein [Blumeria hordei DH14]
MPRKILVVGATGKQGRAIIQAFLTPGETKLEHEYHVYALTRHVGRLNWADDPRLTALTGDLDDAESIVQIFKNAQADSHSPESTAGFWGVVVILAYPGLSTNADGEERQGKMLADLALEYGVQSFIYSSGSRAGPKYEHLLTLSGQAKAAIENHCKDLGPKGLSWTIIRPGFFMENFNDLSGSILAAILKAGLSKNTTFGLIGSKDVGKAVVAIFENHEKFCHKELAIMGQISTISEVTADHLAATGQHLSLTPTLLGWALLKLNAGLQDMIQSMERSHRARSQGEYPSFQKELEAGSSLSHLQTYSEWLTQDGWQESNAWGWNQVSFAKLFTGRS